MSDGLRRRLFQAYWKLQRVIAPGLRYSQELYEDAIAEHLGAGTRWLDLGCGHQALPAWRVEREKELVARCESVAGIDADLPSLRKHATFSRLVCGDITRLPFRSDSFDLVTANMVVEHLDDPTAQFREIHRVLEPGGRFILHTPNALGYTTIITRLVPEFLKAPLARIFEGRPGDDVFPAFYRANTESRLRSLSPQCGFVAETIRLTASSAIFVVITPLVILELLWIRLLLTRRLRQLRTTLIAVLRKPIPDDRSPRP